MVKRLFDIVFSTVFLVLFSPLILIVWLWIKISDRGPAFYMAPRVGLNGKIFHMIKFRTMIVNADKAGPSSTAKNDARMTKTGKILRKYKLDEISQLINVFMGDMSIVGPRPQVEWAVKLYSEEEKKILQLKPGLTDFASIKFHNEDEILYGHPDPDKAYMELIHPEKMRLAIKYLQTQSIITDIKIVLNTLLTVIKK